MKEPTSTQVRVRDHESLSLLLVAPAGCGKTEALAMRVAGLIESRAVVAPRRVLATTFTNRANDNLRGRLRDYLTYQAQRDHVTVANFHGLAARIIRAHGNVIGIDSSMTMPEGDWVTDRCFAKGLGWGGRDTVAELFHVIKQQPLTDEAVLEALATHGDKAAIAIEQERQAENLATYDDMLRYAELILENHGVASLYRNHFAAIIVDEYQDLTPQHLRVLQLLGAGNITFAGDLAQGIYSFAGADPARIDAKVRALCDEVIVFNQSHRSSPAVLEMVNALNALTNGEDLESADSSAWPGGGVAAMVEFGDAAAETDWVVKLAFKILAGAPGHRIGIMSRVKSRLRFIDEHLEALGADFHRWEDGLMDTDTAKIVRATLERLDMVEWAAQPDKIEFIRDRAGMVAIDEPDTRRALTDALTWVTERLDDGLSPADVIARVKVGDDATLLTAPGIHLLSGHVGKGQQFDWVVVVGCEDGNIPFFKATSAEEEAEEARTLGVMLSRARHGLVVTKATVVPTIAGAPKRRDASPFWKVMANGSPHDRAGLVEWLRAVSWADLACH